MFRFRQLSLNLLYFFNLLLVFLLLFENKVELPVFLQVTGRMHPLVLHFPLVLLFVGIFLEWLSSRKDFNHPATRRITTYMFYLFALGASLTALFGFFLYREGSYLGDDVTWHKWLGTGVSVFAVVLLLLREKSRPVYYGALASSVVILIWTGHIGAEITHGEGFLTEPIRNYALAKNARIEHPDSAVVFRDVIQPILNEKCLNCHNSNRAKNNLILSNYESLIKGGKNPGVLISGNAEESLLYKYALLPMDDSLHMPPSDKLQLEQEEIRLIGWWINTGALRDEKYAKLSKPDSIHNIMLSKFQPKSGLDLIDIDFADKARIEALNNPYRTVQQISTSKPYIAVFLGSKKDFSSKDLAELKDVRNQIISIDLGNSRVKDEDLRHLTDFPHLQKLHLQNIAIGDEGIRHLKELRHLNVLNVSGTRISKASLDEVSQWKNLKKLYLYNTTIPDQSVQALASTHPGLEVYSTQFDLSDSVYNAQLTAPVCKIDSNYFRTKASIEIKLSRGNVKYYYTLDGSEPGTGASLYSEPIQVAQSCKLKVMATMAGWIDSKVVTFPLVKVSPEPERVTLESKPDPKYSAKLDSTLVDGVGGGLDRNDKQYLGFSSEKFQVTLQFKELLSLSQVTLSFLEDGERGILPPEAIEIWGGSDAASLVKLGTVNPESPQAKRQSMKDIAQIKFPRQQIRFVKVKAKRARTLPSWVKPKKDLKPMLFLDEVSVE